MMRYAVIRIYNAPWGGSQWAVWDNDLQTWADSVGRFTNYRAALRTARLASLNHAVREQRRKYDEAVAASKPHVAIFQIKRKLVRLKAEQQTLAVAENERRSA